MAALALQQVSRAGLNPTLAAAAAGGDAFPNTGRVFLRMKNAHSVRAATTGNIALANAQTIEGVNVIAGDRVLVKDQATAAENGIYVAAAGAWARAADADSEGDLRSASVFVEEGTAAPTRSGWSRRTR